MQAALGHSFADRADAAVQHSHLALRCSDRNGAKILCWTTDFEDLASARSAGRQTMPDLDDPLVLDSDLR